MKEILKGRIVEIEKKVHQAAYLQQGIPKSKQYQYENKPGIYGSNGSYVTGFDYYGTSVDMKIYVFDLEKCFSIDIRDYILGSNGKSKVSSKLLNYVIDTNKGKKVSIAVSDNGMFFDMNQLDVIPS